MKGEAERSAPLQKIDAPLHPTVAQTRACDSFGGCFKKTAGWIGELNSHGGDGEFQRCVRMDSRQGLRVEPIINNVAPERLPVRVKPQCRAHVAQAVIGSIWDSSRLSRCHIIPNLIPDGMCRLGWWTARGIEIPLAGMAE